MSHRGPDGPPDGWLFLIHQLPPKPDYVRVKVGRRLQRVGAIAIKNSVYVLPRLPEAYEDFEWIAREIGELGGEAVVSEATLKNGLTDAQLRARFNAARDEASGPILIDAARLLKSLGTRRPEASTTEARARAEQELVSLQRRAEGVRAIDFFGSARCRETAAQLERIHERLRSGAKATGTAVGTPAQGAHVWVTRRDVQVDRIASAWLIRRFIDPGARFSFVDATGSSKRAGEVRFDMFDAEYTHEGDACTFETLLARFAIRDRALQTIAEIVHDIDCKDEKFGREEAPGLRRVIAGIAAMHASDDARLARGAMLFDELYAAHAKPGRPAAKR